MHTLGNLENSRKLFGDHRIRPAFSKTLFMVTLDESNSNLTKKKCISRILNPCMLLLSIYWIQFTQNGQGLWAGMISEYVNSLQKSDTLLILRFLTVSIPHPMVRSRNQPGDTTKKGQTIIFCNRVFFPPFSCAKTLTTIFTHVAKTPIPCTMGTSKFSNIIAEIRPQLDRCDWTTSKLSQKHNKNNNNERMKPFSHAC